MFKFKKDKGGYGSQPPTPKITSVSLPVMEGGEVLSPKPKRPNTLWPASPRSNTPHPSVFRVATPLAPATPLKSCLKPRKRTTTITGDTSEAARTASQLREEYAAPFKASPTTTRDKRFSMTGGGSSTTKPKKVTSPINCTFVPMKPPHLPPVNLHWQLLPYHSSLRVIGKPQLLFDITVPLTQMRFAAAPYPRPLRSTDLDKPAADDEELDEMTIECEGLPEKLIQVRRSRGIRCRDVFEKIYWAYNRVLSEHEREKIRPKELVRVQEAFKARCASSPGLTKYEEHQGLRCVDKLLGRTFFLGLTRPTSSSNWVLHLGSMP